MKIAYKTLKNQTTGNVKIGCRLEKSDKTGKSQQAGDTNQVTADLLKTISIGFIAGGLIFNDLIGPFRLITGHAAIPSVE